MSIIERIVLELRNEAEIDFVNTSLIAASVEEDLDLKNQEDIRDYSLKVMRDLMRKDVYPGDYNDVTHLAFWSGTPEEMLKRIEAEWIALGKTPDLANEICWFGLRPPEAA